MFSALPPIASTASISVMGATAKPLEVALVAAAAVHPHAAGRLIEGFGGAAVEIALLAAVMIGCMRLTGRIHWRMLATVILGCAVLFLSAAIMSGLDGAAAGAR